MAASKLVDSGTQSASVHQNDGMPLEALNFLWALVSGLGLAGLLAFAILHFFLPGYLSEKGKNLATKEDIGKITEIVEAVKLQNSALLEERKAHNQLRFAAVDRRLVAHQEAFMHWSHLMRVAKEGHKLKLEETENILNNARSWWYQNALYLEPPVRGRFDNAIPTAGRLPSLLKLRSQEDVTDSTLEAISGGQAEVGELGAAIIRAVELPSLSGKNESFSYLNIELPPIAFHSSTSSATASEGPAQPAAQKLS